MNHINCYVDGFNLYHAIHDLGQQHLKWVDIRKLLSIFVDPKHDEIKNIYYFSAFPTHYPEKHHRHKIYVKALESVGITIEMSSFFEKERKCQKCKQIYIGHEEKQSDVKLAVWMVDHAFYGRFNKALLITGDSDITPAVKLIRQRMPNKRIIVISPPGRRLSDQLSQAVGHKDKRKIKIKHLELSLFPETIRDANGNIIVTRPTEYNPPTPITTDDLKAKFNS